MTRPRLNVLVTSAGRRVALIDCIRKDLTSLGVDGSVEAADASLLTAAGFHADRLHRVPSLSDEGYIPRLVDLCIDRQIGLLVPTIDTELHALSAARDQLRSSGVHVLGSGPKTVAISIDKVRTKEFFTEHAVPSPEQWSGSEALRHMASLPYPMIMKPRRGSASKGIAILGNASELGHVRPTDAYVVQRVHRGPEYTVDVWVDASGVVREAVPRRRIEVRAGEVSKGVTERHAEVETTIRAAAAHLPDAYGPITVQAFADGGSVAVIEINARFGGGYPLAWQAGARYPRWGIQDALGWENDPVDWLWQERLAMLRYDAAVFKPAAEVGL